MNLRHCSVQCNKIHTVSSLMQPAAVLHCSARDPSNFLLQVISFGNAGYSPVMHSNQVHSATVKRCYRYLLVRKFCWFTGSSPLPLITRRRSTIYLVGPPWTKCKNTSLSSHPKPVLLNLDKLEINPPTASASASSPGLTLPAAGSGV